MVILLNYLNANEAGRTKMDATDILLAIVGLLGSVVLAGLAAYLHTMNEKISDIKTSLAELKGLIQNLKER